MEQSKTYQQFGVISPEGVYYGNSDIEDLLYDLCVDEIIPEWINTLIWLETNGWLIQEKNEISVLDKVTDEQIATLCDIIGEEFILLDFINQKKSIFTNRLLELNACELKKELEI